MMSMPEWVIPSPAAVRTQWPSSQTVVKLGLGMSIVPDVAVAEYSPDILVRPLSPPAPRTLGLIERRHNSNEPAHENVRNLLLEPKTD